MAGYSRATTIASLNVPGKGALSLRCGSGATTTLIPPPSASAARPEVCEVGVRLGCRLVEAAGHDVPLVGVERHGDRGVAHDRGERPRVHARGDHQRGEFVPT